MLQSYRVVIGYVSPEIPILEIVVYTIPTGNMASAFSEEMHKKHQSKKMPELSESYRMIMPVLEINKL